MCPAVFVVLPSLKVARAWYKFTNAMFHFSALYAPLASGLFEAGPFWSISLLILTYVPLFYHYT